MDGPVALPLGILIWPDEEHHLDRGPLLTPIINPLEEHIKKQNIKISLSLLQGDAILARFTLTEPGRVSDPHAADSKH